MSRRSFVQTSRQAGAKPTRPGRLVTLHAEPEPIAFDTGKTAVLVIDMQNDFGSKGGMFDRAGIDISGICKAVVPTSRVLSAGRQAGMRIFYLKMGFRPDLSDLGTPGSPNHVLHHKLGVGSKIMTPTGKEGRILIRDTWGTDILHELEPQPGDIVLYKSRYSGFYETDLDGRLKRMGIKHLIFTGCTTSICVDSTLRDAMFRDYWPVLLKDCTAEPIGNGLAHQASLLTVQMLFGSVSTSEKLTEALQSKASVGGPSN